METTNIQQIKDRKTSWISQLSDLSPIKSGDSYVSYGHTLFPYSMNMLKL